MKERQLDARHLLCPMPVIHLQNQIQNLRKGDTIKVVFTDPGGQNDIPAWCRVHGHRIVAEVQDALAGQFAFTIEVGE